jgi:NhaP-type Na+/H+ or K+/H+ antiporter
MTNSEILIAVGILFLAGLLLDKIGRIVHVPRVTLLILLGAVVGPPCLIGCRMTSTNPTNSMLRRP